MYSTIDWVNSGGGVWLGLTNINNATFDNKSDAEANLKYFDGSPYKHIFGLSYKFNDNSPCMRLWPNGTTINDRNRCDNSKTSGLICEYHLASPATGKKRRKRQAGQGEYILRVSKIV